MSDGYFTDEQMIALDAFLNKHLVQIADALYKEYGIYALDPNGQISGLQRLCILTIARKPYFELQRLNPSHAIRSWHWDALHYYLIGTQHYNVRHVADFIQWSRITYGNPTRTSDDPLCQIVGRTIFPNHYELGQMDEYVHKRIDAMHSKLLEQNGYHPQTELSTALSRSVVADIVRPIYDHFTQYLNQNLPHFFMTLREGMYPADWAYQRWHEYLMHYGYTLENSQRYVQIWHEEEHTHTPKSYADTYTISNPYRETTYYGNDLGRYRFTDIQNPLMW